MGFRKDNIKIMPLIIEKGDDATIWGRIDFDNQLIVDHANSIEKLEKKMKKLLTDFFEIDPDQVQFKFEYDLTTLFLHKQFLNISAIAEKAGINPSLMRQYAIGKKFPSKERAKMIEMIIKDLGRELLAIKVSTKKIEQTKTKSKKNRIRSGKISQ